MSRGSPTYMTISTIDLTIVAVYIAAMLGIGYYVFKKVPSLWA